MFTSKKRVGILGSGCWGTAVARIIGQNVLQNPEMFEQEVIMYVYEEVVHGRKLTEIINTDHENVKYLPDTKIPSNVLAVPDVVRATANTDLLVMVLPHQFVEETCMKVKAAHAIKRSMTVVSLIKGFIQKESGLTIVSKVITEALGVGVAVLHGANLATETACEMFCEATIANENPAIDIYLRRMFQTPYFRVRFVRDVPAVEVMGAVKNIVGIGAGLVDGLGFGDNTKAAVVRLGLQECMAFTKEYLTSKGYPGPPVCGDVYLESAGLADLVATCNGGRNRLLGEAIVKSLKKRGMAGVDIRLLEKEILRGQNFQGPIVAKEAFNFLKDKDILDKFPLIAAVHRICIREVDPRNFLDCLREHPEHNIPLNQ